MLGGFMGDRGLSMELVKDISRNNSITVLNNQGFFTAEFVNITGKPKFYNSRAVPEAYISKTKCEKIKKPVKPNEEIVAFKKVQNGYCALYLRA
jgi:hypothetical protein